jgi:Trypsin-like peptidase domain
MISSQILNTVRAGICAIGYLVLPPKTFINKQIDPLIRIVGTGFLVRPSTVMTNRHVIEIVLNKGKEQGISLDNFYVSFMYSRDKAGGLQEGVCKFLKVSLIQNQEIDIGFIDFKRRPEPEFEQCRPLQMGIPSSAMIGQSIAACGYPFGNKFLERSERRYRFGPVLQQGHISAIVPYDNAIFVSEFLLDLRATSGMSGSPLFSPEDGKVIGIIYFGFEATTSFALALDQERINKYLDGHDRSHGQSGRAGKKSD